MAAAPIAGSSATVQDASGAGLPRPAYPLQCRGGAGLVFDTLGPATDAARILRLSLTFTLGRHAAGPEGEALEPSTCAWVDRPLRAGEPRQVRFTSALGDSTPRVTVRDSGLYWSFLAYNTDSGHLEAVGHRHWRTATVATAGPRQTGRSRVDLRHIPLYVMAWVMIAWIPILAMAGRRTGWHRLAGIYPASPAWEGRRFRCGFLFMGSWNYRNVVRLRAGDSHLHFSMLPLFRPGHPPFSVPWSDISAVPDQWPWFPLKGHPVTRFTLSRVPGLRILVPRSVGEGIIAASGGRLELSRPVAAAVAAP